MLESRFCTTHERIPQTEKDVQTFKEISPMEIITQAGQRQQYIDQAQSLNLNIPAISD